MGRSSTLMKVAFPLSMPCNRKVQLAIPDSLSATSTPTRRKKGRFPSRSGNWMSVITGIVASVASSNRTGLLSEYDWCEGRSAASTQETESSDQFPGPVLVSKLLPTAKKKAKRK